MVAAGGEADRFKERTERSWPSKAMVVPDFRSAEPAVTAPGRFVGNSCVRVLFAERGMEV